MNLTLRSRIQEDHLTCPICFMKFTKPKALPCLHTFCLGCLNDYVVCRNYDSEGVFPCPVCRFDVQIPQQGVQGFPNNHIVASLIDTVDESNSSPVVPPDPTQSSFGEAQQHHGILPPSMDPPPTRASPTPGQDKSQPQKLFGSGAHRQYIGQVLSDGVGTAMGVVHNLTGYLNATKPPEPASQTPTSPYEMVNKADIPFGDQTTPNNQPFGDGQTQLYPNLKQDSSGPCSEGLILSLGKYGPGVNDFQKPYGLAAGRKGEIIVTDVKGSRILVFTNAGQLMSRFNIDCEVHGVSVTLDNNLLIAVSKSKSAIMRLYGMNGKLLQSIGDFYRYDLPSGIHVTRKNYVLVSNLAADNILVFTEQRKSSVKFGSKGKGDSHFTQPKFVTSTSKDYIVVSDSGNDCIKIFDITGNLKRTIGRKGDGHGCLNHPLGVATDADDNLIIADSNNFRVEILTSKGGFVTNFLERTNLIGPDVKPINVCVTSDNNIAVLLHGTGLAEVRVYRWRSCQSV